MTKQIFILLVIIVSFGRSSAQVPKIIVSDKTGWHKIAEKTVTFAIDRDEIIVLGSDRFAGLKLKVIDIGIELIGMEIYFEAGDKQIVTINKPIKPTEESDIIKVNGGERELKKIVFMYKTLPNSKDKKAKIEIWGLKTNTDKYD